MRARGIDPFAIERYERTHTADQIISDYAKMEGQNVSVAGRIVSLRIMGKATFAHIKDASGRIQIYLKSDVLGQDQYALVNDIDIGDFVGAVGTVGKTHTGEITVFVKTLQVLAKALRPLPIGKQKGDEHWYSLQDIEQRYRYRYLDLIINPGVMETMLTRTRIIKAIRDFLHEEGFVEVETPVLQALAGGAAARPFITYYNALEHDFHLRISLELYLKRLVIGGFEKVYEMGRVFRNEGLSTRHNPEFTMLELYQAYANLEDIMTLVERMFCFVCREIYGGLSFTYQGNTIDLTPPWKRLPLLEGIKYYTGIAPEDLRTFETARKAGERLGLDMEHEEHAGGIIEKIHERFVQPNLIQPTFVTDYPLETSPLAKKRPDDPTLVRRFEPYLGGQECGNAFSEINDPLDQRERFLYQARLRAAGDTEAHPMDEDFLFALEHGMPPTGGLGIGIDRMVMLFTDQASIRDVILFPQLRPTK